MPRQRSDFEASRIGFPPTRASISAALECIASRSTNANGASRPANACGSARACADAGRPRGRCSRPCSTDPSDPREAVEPLASIDRTPLPPGERAAAQWIAERFRRAGEQVALEEEPSWGHLPAAELMHWVRGLGRRIPRDPGRRRALAT